MNNLVGRFTCLDYDRATQSSLTEFVGSQTPMPYISSSEILEKVDREQQTKEEMASRISVLSP